MYSKITLFIVGIVGMLSGYIMISSQTDFAHPLAAHSITVPDTPHIVFLGSEGAQYGMLTQDDLYAHQIDIIRDWESVREKAFERPLDALLTDSEQLANMAPDDLIWFRSLLSKGVAIAGFGVEQDEFATILGVDTLYAPNEAMVPVGPDGAYLIHGQILGQPDEVALMEANNWFARSITGQELFLPEIKAPLVTSRGKTRIVLDSEQGVQHLFKSLSYKIEGAYQKRAEYQLALERFLGGDQ